MVFFKKVKINNKIINGTIGLSENGNGAIYIFNTDNEEALLHSTFCQLRDKNNVLISFINKRDLFEKIKDKGFIRVITNDNRIFTLIKGFYFC